MYALTVRAKAGVSVRVRKGGRVPTSRLGSTIAFRDVNIPRMFRKNGECSENVPTRLYALELPGVSVLSLVLALRGGG